MEICIESVTITPNPCTCGAKILIQVELYSLYPATDLHPALDLYPGADLFNLYPEEALYPGTDLYPAEGGIA